MKILRTCPPLRRFLATSDTILTVAAVLSTTTIRAYAVDPPPPPPPPLSAWQSRWNSGNTQWHRTQVHPSLIKYGDDALFPTEQFPAGGARILVPLCGKSVDLVHLAQKRKVAQVVGVEGVATAVQAFAKEHPELNLVELEQCPEDGDDAAVIRHLLSKQDEFKVWEGNSIRILNGNFFSLRQSNLYDGIWDRAALVAITPESRPQYVDKLGELLRQPSGRILLATWTRPDGNVTKGPPFSIDETEVRRLFENKPWVKNITLLEDHSALGMEPWYKAIGMYLKFGGDVRERIFLIEAQ